METFSRAPWKVPFYGSRLLIYCRGCIEKDLSHFFQDDSLCSIYIILCNKYIYLIGTLVPKMKILSRKIEISVII